MKFNAKEYFKLSIIYTLVGAFPPVLQILVQPIIEGKNKLGAVEFSKMSIAESITSLVFVLAMFAMGNAISRFYYDYRDSKEKYNRLISTVFNSILLRGILIFGLALLFGNYIGEIFHQKDLQDFSSYGYASIVIGINRAINITAASLYRNEKRVMTFVILNVVLGILRSAFQIIGVFYFDMSFKGYVYGAAIGTSFTSVAIIIYTYYKSGIRLDLKILKEINSFARPLFQYGIISWGILFADRYFLEATPVDLGIYDMALKFTLGIQMVIQGLQGAVQPEVFRLMSEGIEKSQENIKKYVNLFLAQTQLIIALLIIPVIIYIDLSFDSKIKLSSLLITILFTKYILRTQYNAFSFLVYYLKKTKFFFYVNAVVLIINLTLNYFLVPLFHAYGAITAAFVSEFILLITIFLYQRKLSKIKWNLNKTLFFPISIVIIAIIIEILKNIFDINNYICSGFIVLYILSSLTFLYKTELTKIINKLTSR